ncbi:MAG: sulfur carrier protein ThiS adenylyltransferase ThiF [Kiritimatiellia bacterium]
MGCNPYLTEIERDVLERARIGIAGAGGLGSNCAMHLVRAGVKKFVICDFDVVNASNLNRQFFFRDQIGRKKVEALGENLRRIEPDLELDLRDVELDAASVADVFSACDIVVEAFDNARAKAMLLAALIPAGRTVVAASGLAGWGRSRQIGLRRMGRNLVMVGDGAAEVCAERAPVSPRVGIAAAMEANSVVALLLGKEL